MNSFNHYAIFLSNQSEKHLIIQQLLPKNLSGVLANFNEIKGTLFSKIGIGKILDLLPKKIRPCSISKNFRKSKFLMKMYQENPSLKIFVESILAKNITT